MTSPLDDRLSTVFAADRALRIAELEFLDDSGPAHLAALARALDAALALEDAEESGIRCIRIADLLGEFQGPEVVTALLRLLDNDEPTVREAAGSTLLDLGYSRWAEVARGVEKLIDDWLAAHPDHPAIPHIEDANAAAGTAAVKEAGSARS